MINRLTSAFRCLVTFVVVIFVAGPCNYNILADASIEESKIVDDDLPVSEAISEGKDLVSDELSDEKKDDKTEPTE